MAKRKKRRVKRPGITTRLVYLGGRFMGWLCWIMARRARQNPLLACGLVLFCLTLGFVSKNAFFNQPETYRRAFFATRSEAEQLAGTGRALLAPEKHTAFSVPAREMEQAADLKTLQKKLAGLGLYDGNIDGLSGPRTRKAIRKWQALQQSLGQDNTVSIRGTDHVGAVIRGSAISSAAAGEAEEQAIASRETVMRIQAALRTFGNGNIVVNGVVDDATEKAVRAFQKMFALPETGRVNSTLTDKMREIGLFG